MGRVAGGACCVGCNHYQSNRTTAGSFTGKGRCLERERDVFAVYRGACGLYEFHTTKQQQARV
jgi:hypothetical protein